MNTQDQFEAAIEASMPMMAVGDGIGILERVISAVGGVAQSAKAVFDSLGGQVNDATVNMMIAAAKKVLEKILLAYGVPASIVTPALTLLETLVEFMRSGS